MNGKTINVNVILNNYFKFEFILECLQFYLAYFVSPLRNKNNEIKKILFQSPKNTINIHITST